MKRIWMGLIALLLAIPFPTGYARTAAYTDVPGSPTQDSVLAIQTRLVGAAEMEYTIASELPDIVTVNVLEEVYGFVMSTHEPVARYFPEEVQRQIEAVLHGGDPDILHMTEFQNVAVATCQHEDVQAEVKVVLDVEYHPGQLVVAMIGVKETADEVQWVPLEAEVTDLGTIEFTIPYEVLSSIQSGNALFSVLTDRVGSRGGVMDRDQMESGVFIPSKTAEDIQKIEKFYVTGEASPQPDLSIMIIKPTRVMLEELSAIREYVKDEGQPLITYFDQAIQTEVALMLPEGFDVHTLLSYEALAVAAINYVDTYGDAVTSFRFSTPYENGQAVVAVIGVPKKEKVLPGEPPLNWYTLRAEVQEGLVDITFKQLVLPIMQEQGALMLLMSEPLTEETGR